MSKITFGKHRGKTWAHVAQFDPSYIDWAVDTGIIPEATRTARDRGELPRKKLPLGSATVFYGDYVTPKKKR